MKNFNCKIAFFLTLSLITLNSTKAQWQPDVRLTNNPFYSATCFNNAWCTAANGNSLHVVWYDFRDANYEIYYKRSDNGGINWGEDTRLTNNSGYSDYPSISVSGSFVHVVWRDYRNGNDEIYYKHSTDGGASWEADIRLTNNPSYSMYPSMSVSGSAVHIVWYDQRDGNFEVYYKRSTDGGTTWDADIRLTNAPLDSRYPSISVSGSVVHVIWFDYRSGNYEIYYKRSTDSGASWGSDIQLTSNPAASRWPSVAVSGSAVHVIWSDNRDGNDEIYYKRSTDGGTNWEADLRITNATQNSYDPNISVSGSSIHVAWWDQRENLNGEIYYIRSTDGGTNWEAETRLTNNSAISYEPSVSVSGSVVNVIWQDTRDGNYEIYYKRNPNGSPLGINTVNNENPAGYVLSQNYPNPFNPATSIKFQVPHWDFVVLKIYDGLGKEAATLVDERLNPGTYEVKWDASNYATGVYYYKLISSDFIDTKKMILSK